MNGKLTEEDIITHYQNILLVAGWKSFRTQAMDENYYRFIKESACLDLNIYESKYKITIWHDIWGQDFSPPKPNMFC